MAAGVGRARAWADWLAAGPARTARRLRAGAPGRRRRDARLPRGSCRDLRRAPGLTMSHLRRRYLGPLTLIATGLVGLLLWLRYWAPDPLHHAIARSHA